jgi:hypothetical protein
MSLFTMAFLGMAPFGSLLAGGLASTIGASSTVILNGSICIVGGVLFARQLPMLKLLVHPIYIEKGILPAIPLELPAP